MGVSTVIKEHYSRSVLLTLLFAALAVIGQVGQNVSLPLWTVATNTSCKSSDSDNDTANSSSDSNSTTASGGTPTIMDPYFVLSFASLSFVAIFGLASLLIAAIRPGKYITKEDLKFPQWQFFLIGFFDALDGVLVVFASVPSRTAPFLQAILGNFLIPLTIVFR